jgi:hypothetical protein
LGAKSVLEEPRAMLVIYASFVASQGCMH